jgi:hypothetical protein
MHFFYLHRIIIFLKFIERHFRLLKTNIDELNVLSGSAAF